MSLTRVWSANTSRMYSAGARCSIACPSLPRCSRSIARSLSHHFQSLASMGKCAFARSGHGHFTMGHFLRFRLMSPQLCPTNAYPQPRIQGCQACSGKGILVPQPPLPAPHRRGLPIPRLLIISHSELSRPDQFVVLTVHSPTWIHQQNDNKRAHTAV